MDPPGRRVVRGRRLSDPGGPSDRHIRAWRYWLLSPAGRLRSISQRWIEWPTEGPIVARCLGGGHAAPDPGCACGVYGAATFEALLDHGLCVVPTTLVVGEVDLYGRRVVDDDGIRAEAARPARLALVPETLEGGRVDVAAAMESLSAYGVEVTAMPLGEAVTGITAAMLANQLMASRARGPSRPAGY